MSDLKIFAKALEPEAQEQVRQMAENKAYRNCKIRIMPDCHAGKGCTVGTVIKTRGRRFASVYWQGQQRLASVGSAWRRQTDVALGCQEAAQHGRVPPTDARHLLHIGMRGHHRRGTNGV